VWESGWYESNAKAGKDGRGANLDAPADPNVKYDPRPEWYFLFLFQLLKYFPGPLEPVATMVIPGLLVGGLLALPFLDRRPDRHPLKRPLVTAAFTVIGVALASLTWLGLEDSPAHANRDEWGPVSVAGRELAADERCTKCHATGGAASPLAETRLRRDPEWLLSHVQDPEIIAPGLREAPPGGMNTLSGRAVLAYMRRLRAGSTGPEVNGDVKLASRVFATRCANCHRVDGEGDGSAGGDLSHIGREKDAKWLREWISDPSLMDEDVDMPAFGERLSEEEMTAIVNFLAAHR
jgi:ubiquinol-cytochrome c reductase cytochrome b subunit